MLERWEIHLGMVPGFIFGYRSYVDQEECKIEHVLYLGIVDISLSLYYDC